MFANRGGEKVGFREIVGNDELGDDDGNCAEVEEEGRGGGLIVRGAGFGDGVVVGLGLEVLEDDVDITSHLSRRCQSMRMKRRGWR